MNTEAQKFLDYLGGHTKCWHFQSFDDKHKGGAATTPRGPFTAVLADTLAVVNNHGGGVFVAVNSHSPRLVRAKKNSTHINALFIDIDDGDAEVAKGKMLLAIKTLPATMVVESSPSKYHVYWCLADSESIPVVDFGRWQRKLAKEFDSDPVIHNTDRVMRVPGFLHQKGEPFLARIIAEYTTGVKYSLDDLVTAFYGGRNNWITAVAGALRRDAVPQQEISEVLHQRNNLLHVPLDEDEVELIVGSVAAYAPDVARAATYETGQIALRLNLDVDRSGGVISSAGNMFKIVEHEKPSIWNLFAQCKERSHTASFNRRATTSKWEDSDTVSYMKHLTNRYSCSFHKNTVIDAIEQSATENMYDPLVNYLGLHVWDNKPRIEQVFQQHLGVEDSEYIRAVAKVFFVGAVKRAMEPGCQYPTMLVIVGEEGGGKSKFPAVIAKYREFYTDSVGDVKDTKEAVQSIQGKWIVEFPEMRAFMGVSAGSEHSKAFITSEIDNIRLSYGRENVALPRRCIFSGSTNNMSFLTDDGANRRYLPIYSPYSEESGIVLDIPRLEKEVDQLWAEAVVMYNAGVSTQIPPELVGAAREERLQYAESGGYEEEIIRYMEDDQGSKVNGVSQKRDVFRTRDFFLFTGGSAKEWGASGSATQNRITNAAKKVFALPEWSGYSYGRHKTHGLQWRGWKLVKENCDE